MSTEISLESIEQAQKRVSDLVKATPLIRMPNYSEKLGAEVYFKREDLQRVRSYKIRGALNKIRRLTEDRAVEAVVCSSAGNHAQGVALACAHLNLKGIVFMPTTTPQQKIQQVKMFGRAQIEVKLAGDSYDACYQIARSFCDQMNYAFVHPFDDPDIVRGQATVGLELLNDLPEGIDYLLVPVGGGGLISGLIEVFRRRSPETKIIAVEPEGAPSLKFSLDQGRNSRLEEMDKFVDGAAVQKMGDLNFDICRDRVSKVVLVPEGKICSTMLKLYNEKAIVVEPAGALSVSALDSIKDELIGKRVVCILSGGNNDISRMEEIKERALLFEGLKHYFLVSFPQRAGALKEFVVEVLGPADDITYFEYTKKNSRARSSAVVGIELKGPQDFSPLLKRMKDKGFYGSYLNEQPDLFQFLV